MLINKTKNKWLILFLLFASIAANSENLLDITNDQVNVNEIVTTSIEMNNDSIIMAFQADILLPSGTSYVTSSVSLN